MFEWTDQLDTGIAEIDQQHRHLVEILARLFKAMQSGAGKDVLNDTLIGLARYTEEHFAHEEALMTQHDYPEAQAHREAHEVFRHKVEKLDNQFKENEQGALSIQVVLLLRNWLTEHIGSVDQEFGRFLSEENVA